MGSQAARKAPFRVAEGECLVETVLENAARELTCASESCVALQWMLSSLLEHAHHPDLPAELHLLQDIDRVQQILKDISTLLELVSRATGSVSIAKDHLVESLQLDSLRERLLPLTAPQPDESPAEDTADNSDVTWF